MNQATKPTASPITNPGPSGDAQAPETKASTASTPVLDDDVLANAIQSELRHDALTAALPIEVEVWDRVVHLRGVVSGAREAEAAESVVERVEGVGLVADDLQMGPAQHPQRNSA